MIGNGKGTVSLAGLAEDGRKTAEGSHTTFEEERCLVQRDLIAGVDAIIGGSIPREEQTAAREAH